MGNYKHDAIQDFMISDEIKHTVSNQNKCQYQSAFVHNQEILQGPGVYDERTKTKNEEGKFCVSARSGQVFPPTHTGLALISLHTSLSTRAPARADQNV